MSLWGDEPRSTAYPSGAYGSAASAPLGPPSRNYMSESYPSYVSAPAPAPSIAPARAPQPALARGVMPALGSLGAPPLRQQFAPPPAPGFMSALGSMGSSAPAAAPVVRSQPPSGLPHEFQVLFKDKTTGMFYGKKEGKNAVSIADVYFNGSYYDCDFGTSRVIIGADTLVPAPGGVLVGGKRRKSRRSTRRKSRR